ncbi:MAG: hypothetical protein SGARI_007199 [Bacillariaceae sp.]
MLLKLVRSSTQAPVRLNLDASVPTQQGDEIVVVGRGITTDENGYATKPTDLQQVSLNYISNDECSTYKNDQGAGYTNLVEDNMMCVKGINDGTTYTGWFDGDSGGPLIIKGDNAGEDIQVGIVSKSALGLPGIASRLSAQKDVLQELICTISSSAPAYLQCNAYSEPIVDEEILLQNPTLKKQQEGMSQTVQIALFASVSIVVLALWVVGMMLCCRSTKTKKELTVTSDEESTSSDEEQCKPGTDMEDPEDTEALDITETGDLDEVEAQRKVVLENVSNLRKQMKMAASKDAQESCQAILRKEMRSLKSLNHQVSILSPRTKRKSAISVLDQALDISF